MRDTWLFAIKLFCSYEFYTILIVIMFLGNFDPQLCSFWCFSCVSFHITYVRVKNSSCLYNTLYQRGHSFTKKYNKQINKSLWWNTLCLFCQTTQIFVILIYQNCQNIYFTCSHSNIFKMVNSTTVNYHSTTVKNHFKFFLFHKILL